MGDNGKIIGEESKEPQEQKILEMRITVEPGKAMQVHFPFLGDKIATYGFLKLAEKVLDAHYEQSNPKIIQPKGSMMNFVRGKR